MKELYFATLFFQAITGALILNQFDWWLRRRGVRDSSLKWLYLSLLSWSATDLAELLHLRGLPFPLGLEYHHILYILSPISSALFFVTAFRLSRVKELIRHHDLERWSMNIVWVFIFLCASEFALNVAGASGAPGTLSVLLRLGINIDAVLSLLALFALGFGLSYSFYKYGNPLLIVLTGITFIYIIWRQFDVLGGMTHDETSVIPSGIFAGLNCTFYGALNLLFIALAVAWGLSDASRLKRVGNPTHVKVIVMVFDLRGSTQWSAEVAKQSVEYVGTLLDELQEWTTHLAFSLPQGRPALIKFLGDGFMFIWEVPSDSHMVEAGNAVADLAYRICRGYPSWIKATPTLWLGAPRYIGAGVALGSALRLTFEDGSDDYIGSPLNLAAKLQNLARPFGGVIVHENWSLCEQVASSFSNRGEVVIGPESVPVRATSEVDFLIDVLSGTI